MSATEQDDTNIRAFTTVETQRGFHTFFVFPVFWYCRIGYNVLTTKIASSFIDVWFLIDLIM